MTAFTTVPFFVCPSGDASLTLAVTTSPSPARRPVDPPSGRIICNLRAPLLSATSSMLRIITAIVFPLTCEPRATTYEQPRKRTLIARSLLTSARSPHALPAPARFCAQFPSTATASILIADASLPVAPHRRRGLHSSHHAHRTFSPSR